MTRTSGLSASRIALILVALLAAWGLYSVIGNTFFAAEAPRIMTAEVRRADIEQTVLATGTLKPSRLVAVGAQVSGRVTSLKVRLGEAVKAGDLVAQIDSVPQQNALRTAEAALANMKAQKEEKEATLVLANLTLARQTKMVAQKAVSEADFQAAQADVRTTRAQIAALEAQIQEAQVAVETARVNLGYTRITAPIDGTVLAIVTQEGQTVNAAQSAPTIVIIGQLDVMTVRAEISEADIVKVRPGQPLYFSIVGEPDRRYEATLGFIEPAPESIKNDSSFSDSTSGASSSSSSSSSSAAAVYYIGVFDVPNKDGRLRTYMTAQVNIVTGSARDVLAIPSAALGVRGPGGGYTVRVVDGSGAVTRRNVEAGIDNKILVEIRSGLTDGERVVTGEAGGASAPSVRRGPPAPMGL